MPVIKQHNAAHLKLNNMVKPGTDTTKTPTPAKSLAGVRFTSPERVIYPETGVTKLEIATHYLEMAPLMLPHLAKRPVTMIRCPDNYHKCFFQKHMDKASQLGGLSPVKVQEDKGAATYASVESAGGLIALVQLGVVEFHTPGVRSDRLTHPDRFIMDLDPDPTVGWEAVVEAARALRDLLQELGLTSFVKTTGGKGLHVVTPIRRTLTVEEVRQFSGAVAGLFEAVAPKRYTTNISKAKRKGRILIDYFRNSPGATAVEVYSARAREGAPVAVPVHWEELDKVRGDSFHVRNAKDRLASLRADPWLNFFTTRQAVTVKARRQVGL